MPGKVAILVVNGFDRAGMLGTQFDADEVLRFPWIDVCLREVLRRSADTDHEVFVWDNSHMTKLRDLIKGHGARLYPSDAQLESGRTAAEPDAPVMSYLLTHAASLQSLLLQVGGEFDYVVTLDSDSFPVRDGWLEILKSNLATSALTGVWRDEMPGHLPAFVHPSGLSITRRRLLQIEQPFAFVGGQAVASRISANVLEAGESVMPLRRSNARNAHFLIGGIYGDLIYHHGAGSRAPVFWMTQGEERDQKVHAILRREIFEDVDRVIAVMRGEVDDDLGLDWDQDLKAQANFVRTSTGVQRVTGRPPVVPSGFEPATSSAWLDELPEEMSSHVTHLRRLMDFARADPRMRALQVQGSVGRGTGDRLSDLDVGLVVLEEAWPAITGEMADLLRNMGEVVDDHYHFLPTNETPEIFKAWAHFNDGIQVDLLVLPTSRLLGSGPDGRTLFDRDGILVRTDHPRRLSDPAAIADWAFLSWQNLTEVAKYLERGRPVGAAEWLSSARQATISCWAAAHGVEYAGFANVAAARLGVSAPWPNGLEKAYPGTGAGSVLEAALALADVQERADGILTMRLGIPPRPLAAWVRTKLELMRSELPIPDSLPGPGNPPGR